MSWSLLLHTRHPLPALRNHHQNVCSKESDKTSNFIVSNFNFVTLYLLIFFSEKLLRVQHFGSCEV